MAPPFQYTKRNETIEDYISAAERENGVDHFLTKEIEEIGRDEWLVSYTIVPNPSDKKYNTHFLVTVESLLPDSVINNDAENSAKPSASEAAKKFSPIHKGKDIKGKGKASASSSSSKKKHQDLTANSGRSKKRSYTLLDEEAQEINETVDSESVPETPKNVDTEEDALAVKSKYTTTSILVSSLPIKKDMMTWQCRLVGIVKDRNLGIYGNYHPYSSMDSSQTSMLGNAHISVTITIDEKTRRALQHLDADIQRDESFKTSDFASYYGVLRKDSAELSARIKLLIPRWKWAKEGRGVPEDFDDRTDPEKWFRTHAKDYVPVPVEDLDRFARASPDSLEAIDRQEVPIGAFVELTISLELWRSNSGSCGVSVILDELVVLTEKYKHVSSILTITFVHMKCMFTYELTLLSKHSLTGIFLARRGRSLDDGDSIFLELVA